VKQTLTAFWLSCSLVGQVAQACDPGGAELFQPDPSFRGSRGGVPAPVVRVKELTRSTAAPGSSCDDAGTITLDIRMPPASWAKISDYGVYFRELSGTPSGQIFPTIPVVGPIKDGVMRIQLSWLDGAPPQQQPINLRVEAFLVSKHLSIGPSAEFEVQHP
jgi:hypothetical protein